MFRYVECGASFPDPLKRWAGDDMIETSFAGSTSAIDVASRVFGRNRPETTCMVMSCATLDDRPHVVCDAKLGAAGCRLRCIKMSSAI